MRTSQKINWHLSTDETLFSQIIELETRSFAALISPICPINTRQEKKLYQWLSCPNAETALAVFETLIKVVMRQSAVMQARRLTIVSNPTGWGIIDQAQQRDMLGSGVAVVHKPPPGLVKGL